MGFDAAAIRRYVHLAALILEAVDRFLESEQQGVVPATTE